MRRLHVVGGGLAGLAAAHAAARRGVEVRLYEGAPQAGGRCRTIRPADGFVHDNGTHVLLTANRRALAFIDAVGARAGWIEPEPDGLPVYDPRDGSLRQVGLSPWSWLKPERRPAGLAWSDLPRLAGLSNPFRDRPIADAIGARPILESLVEPMTVAVLNTPVEAASSRRLGLALRRMAAPGASRLLVAREGLGPDLVEPALAALERLGVAVASGARLRGVEQGNGRATALHFGDGTVTLEPEDGVVLALPPWEIGRLLPSLPVPDRFEPILNAHYRLNNAARPRFVGLIGTLAQWVLARPDHVSVTVSSAAAVIDTDPDALAARIWREIAPALSAVGVPADPEAQPEARVVKEKRATLRQAAGPATVPPLRPLANLALAGDWLTPLPATIEAAVVSGEAAIGALARRQRATPANGYSATASQGPPR